MHSSETFSNVIMDLEPHRAAQKIPRARPSVPERGMLLGQASCSPYPKLQIQGAHCFGFFLIKILILRWL